MEGSSSHAITRCMASFSNLHDKPSPLTYYAVNRLSTRAAAYQRRGYIRVGAYLRLEYMSSSGAYGKVKRIPSLTSYWGTRNVTPTRRVQLNCSWLSGKNKRRMIIVSIFMSKGTIFPRLFFLLVEYL